MTISDSTRQAAIEALEKRKEFLEEIVQSVEDLLPKEPSISEQLSKWKEELSAYDAAITEFQRYTPSPVVIPAEHAKTIQRALNFERQITVEQNPNTFVAEWRQVEIDKLDAALEWLKLQRVTGGE